MRGSRRPNYEAILLEAQRTSCCPECGDELIDRQHRGRIFCSSTCSYRWRDRLRYLSDPEGQRARSRAYYWANRERILAKAAAKRGTPQQRNCSECGAELEGRRRVVCDETCRERRFKRLHPDAYAAKEARKVERRRARRREARQREAEA